MHLQHGRRALSVTHPGCRIKRHSWRKRQLGGDRPLASDLNRTEFPVYLSVRRPDSAKGVATYRSGRLFSASSWDLGVTDVWTRRFRNCWNIGIGRLVSHARGPGKLMAESQTIGIKTYYLQW